jgi:L-gulono-1,4-lactone dehydrogenase
VSTRAWRNWAGNQTARPRYTASPTSTEQVADVLVSAAAEGLRVKAVGSGHSFTGVALTDGILMRGDGLTGVRAFDESTGLITVGSGTTLRDLCRLLDERARALINLGDISAQTVAGAIATGTHGTGRDSAGLAAQVCGLEIVLADGEVVECSEQNQSELFAAARLGLGALGVVTAVTFQTEPAFRLHAREEPMPLEFVLDYLDDLAAANDHFEFYWFPHTSGTLTKRNNRTGAPPEPLSARRAWFDDELLANTVFGLTCRAGLAVSPLVKPINQVATRMLGTREYVDVSHRVFTTPRRVRFLEMEYALPRAALVPALRELRTLIDSAGWRISFPLEIRLAPADDVWLSTAYQRESAYVAVHLHHRSSYQLCQDYFGAMEAVLVAHEGRPHWGKLHTRDAAQLRESCPMFARFVDLRDKVDPERRFGNAYLRRVLGD